MDRVKNKNTISYNGSRLYMNSKDEFKFNNYRRVFKLSEVFTPHSIFEKIKENPTNNSMSSFCKIIFFLYLYLHLFQVL